MRLHILGASGSGTTTLGRALASHWSIPCHDTDDYYWLPTDPPFREKRPIPERLALMEAMFLPRRQWILSGHLCSWGGPLIPRFDAVVFVSLDNDTRLARLRDREIRRYGDDATAVTDERRAHMKDFLDWAAKYEDPSFTGRSRATHEAWLAKLPCPVLRVDSATPTADLVTQIAHTLGDLAVTRPPETRTQTARPR